MLRALQIENFGLIQHLDLEWPAGLVAITGESGSGKSQLLEAILAGLGLRWEGQWLGRFGPRCRVVEVWEIAPHHPAWAVLEEAGVEREAELVIQREVTADRSSFRVMGQPVSQRTLRAVASRLVEYAGQHGATRLGPSEILEWLDRALGLIPLRDAVSSAYKTWKGAEQRLAEWAQGLPSAAERERLLEELEALEALNLRPGEDEEVAAELERLRHRQRLAEGYARVLQWLQGSEGGVGVERSVYEVGRELRAMAQLDPSLQAVAETWEAIVEQVKEAGWELGRWQAAVDWNASHLEALEERADLLARARRRWGPTLDEVIHRRETLRAESLRWQALGLEEHRLQRAREEASEAYRQAAQKLSDARRQNAPGLAAKVVELLADMEMPGARFEFQWDQAPCGPEGMDRLEVAFAAAPGQPLKPLAKVASGGELARVALAMTLLESGQEGATFLLDEPDSGLGGVAALRVGQLLHGLAAHNQVVLVTHQPTIAALAGRQLLVEKWVGPEGAVTRVRWVTGPERTAEVARMLSGQQDEAALRHAASLLNEEDAGGQRVG
ncbi:MAG: AAA family ATPase [Firmicutes bacterium]|nr:AAA family ATPase [Bacillota bacterium]